MVERVNQKRYIYFGRTLWLYAIVYLQSYVALNHWTNKSISINDVLSSFEALHSISLLVTVSVCFWPFWIKKINSSFWTNKLFIFSRQTIDQHSFKFDFFIQSAFVLTNSVVGHMNIALGFKSGSSCVWRVCPLISRDCSRMSLDPFSQPFPKKWSQSITTSTTYHHHRHNYCHDDDHHHHHLHHRYFLFNM